MVVNSFKRLLNFTTGRIYNLPVLIMMPHSRCNCRCVMCDIWKANHDKKEISVETLKSHVAVFRKFGVKEIVLSGGEPLMHSNFWEFARLLKSEKIRITLLSTGLLLARHAPSIVNYIDNVIVSLDGSREVHDKIRQVPNAFDKLHEGVSGLKRIKNDYPVSGRCVLQRENFRDYINIVATARAIGLDRISFLAADLSSGAFNRTDPWSKTRSADVALSSTESTEFEKIIIDSFKTLAAEYRTKFIAESPGKMRKLAAYYKALNGLSDFSETVCNAPLVSAVVESNGDVLPCFFHKPYGNIYENSFEEIINSSSSISFRKKLDVSKNAVCRKCVCTLKLGVTEMV